MPRVRLGGVGGGVWSSGRMVLAGENRSAGRGTCPVSLYPPQIPHWLAWDSTQAYAVTGRTLTTWAVARSSSLDVISSQFQSSGWWVDFLAGRNVEAKRKIPAHGGIASYMHVLWLIITSAISSACIVVGLVIKPTFAQKYVCNNKSLVNSEGGTNLFIAATCLGLWIIMREILHTR